MKLGIGLGYAGATLHLPIERIQRAEALGYDAVWTSESYSSDALTPLAFIAAHTKKIKLATNVVQLAARTAANLAMCAQTIDAMAGGNRVIVGIGVSGPQIVEGWYGEPWGRPNYRIRDYVAIVRRIFRRDAPVAYEGKEISLPWRGPGSTGLGKPLKNIMHGNPDIPIFLGTATDLNIRMTAEIADGWLPNARWPGFMKVYGPIIDEGLARRTDGRTRKDFQIQGGVAVSVGNDVKTALDALKPHTALYVGGMGARNKNFHYDTMVKRGYPEAAARIQELFLAGRKDEAAAAVPDEYIDEGSLVGPPARIRERWKPWLDSGYTGVTIGNPTDEVLELMAGLPRG
ncbi:MAG: LLM class F420-dependent oxidoreductase [Gammaproteobacteria bacterium]